jgi:hypothetical protein
MEFDCTAMHFRFEREEDVKIPFCLLGYEATREAAMTGFAKSWRRL